MPPVVSHPTTIYPDSDGRRMAENTLQAEWIIAIFTNLDWLFADRPDVFVAMDNLWYPVEGKPKRRAAPDVYVVFGRPKGRRGSYKQWEEGGVPLHVVFEVLSPGNRHKELIRKFRFYERYGVEEYYIIDPDQHTFEAWHRVGQKLHGVRINGGLVSPRLGIRFEWKPGTDVVLFYPDGKPFLSYRELAAARHFAEQQLATTEQQLATTEQQLATTEQQLATTEQQLATTEQQLATTEQQLATVKQQAQTAAERAAALAAKLRSLGIDPDAVS
jgi:Uma2 family endonuclease